MTGETAPRRHHPAEAVIRVLGISPVDSAEIVMHYLGVGTYTLEAILCRCSLSCPEPNQAHPWYRTQDSR
jgi:hypothetical protein